MLWSTCCIETEFLLRTYCTRTALRGWGSVSRRVGAAANRLLAAYRSSCSPAIHWPADMKKIDRVEYDGSNRISLRGNNRLSDRRISSNPDRAKEGVFYPLPEIRSM